MDYQEMSKTIDDIIARHEDRKPIVAILQDIQEEYRYLPKEALVLSCMKYQCKHRQDLQRCNFL